MKPKSPYEETVFYQDISLKNKDKWISYFRVLYNERDLEHERFTESVQAQLLKEAGLSAKSEDTIECLEGLNAQWIMLLNGFFRHYHSRVYTEYCMALKNYEKLVEAQFRDTKDQKEVGYQNDNLIKMKGARLHLDSLEKEIFNEQHGDMANIVNPHALFKDGPTENAAKNRGKQNPRKRAVETKYE